MGGYHSGTWARHGAKDRTAHNLPLDVRYMHRSGHLQPGTAGTLRWLRGERDAGSIGFLTRGSTVLLEYRHRGEHVTQEIAVTWTPCHYGGARPWWVCPDCGRRCAVLYAPGRLFSCRVCYDLAYPSQNEGPRDRGLAKAQDIRRRLGGSGSILARFPDKPKGMHWETYMRLYREHNEAAETYTAALLREFDVMDGWAERKVRELRRAGERRRS